jgi:hypothetical protein
VASIKEMNESIIDLIGDVSTIKGIAYSVPNGTLIVDDNENETYYLHFIPNNKDKQEVELNVYGIETLKDFILQKIIK